MQSLSQTHFDVHMLMPASFLVFPSFATRRFSNKYIQSSQNAGSCVVVRQTQKEAGQRLLQKKKKEKKKKEKEEEET